jgi:aspartate racemase
MRTLGLLGGMSWESTTAYYQQLNRLARDQLGGQHSARLLLWSFDFAPLSTLMAEDRWDEVGDRLAEAARRLESAGAQAVIICSNTTHLTAPAVQAAIGVPLLHVVDAAAAAVLAGGGRRPLLLATRFTMEKAFYRDHLKALGLDPVIPPLEDRTRLHAIIFDELILGRFEPASRAQVIAIAKRAVAEAGADSVILGCTEFGLLVGPEDFPVPVFDTTEIHARAAMDFALAA